tara:strand:- start:854 stop:985 length:132 start_codon:yes stop_codon:yes gene_type:complete
MNITSESEDFAKLLEKMNQVDKTTEVTPQVCNLDGDDCLTCGS